MISPGKAMGFGISVFVMLIVSVASVGILPKLPGFKSALPGADVLGSGDSSSRSGLAAMASKNSEMTETMRKQLNQEAQEIINKCVEAGGKCQEVELLKEICSGNNILKLESCSDPKVMALLKVSQ